jgi:hypothetical protein
MSAYVLLFQKHCGLHSIMQFEQMLQCKKIRAYLEMEAECKLASQEKNPEKEVPVINSERTKRPLPIMIPKGTTDHKWNPLSCIYREQISLRSREFYAMWTWNQQDYKRKLIRNAIGSTVGGYRQEIVVQV